MNRASGGRPGASAKGRSWLLSRRDLADGAGMLLRLAHPLLPEIAWARPTPEGLLLGPAVAPPAALVSGLDPETRSAFLVRLVSLTSFLKLHGLGIAPEDVGSIGARAEDSSRPCLAAAPVPDWRAASPALVAAAVAARLGGALPEGENAPSLRASVRRAVERGLSADAVRDVLTALTAEESGRRPEALLFELARRRDIGRVGPDLLGLVYPSVFASEGENGTIQSAWGPAALWIARGAARRQPDAPFVECGPGPPLEEGSALRRLARLLDGDRRADALEKLAAGKSSVTSPDGAPVAVVALDAGCWDPRSRSVFETVLGEEGLTRFETRAGPPRAWEVRTPLVPRLGVGEISSLLYLPHATLGESVAAWESAARSAAGDPGRLLVAARRLAARFDPSGRRERPGAARARAAPDSVLEAASLLADGFPVAEAAAAAGVDAEQAAAALMRAVESGTLVEDDTGFSFQDQAERGRVASKTTSRARCDAIARLEEAGIEPERLVVAALARASVRDVDAARHRLKEAAASGDTAAALRLLRRAPASSPDLGVPVLALNVLFDAGRLEEARHLAQRLTEADCRAVPDGERSSLARRLVKLREAGRALALFESPRTPAESLARARILVEARREEEATLLLASPDFSAADRSPTEKTEAVVLRAEIAERRHDYETAAALLREVRELLPRVPDPALAFDATMTAGYLAADMTRWDEALSFFRAARSAAADDGRRADATLDIAVTAIWAGRFAEADRELEAALGMYARRGDEPSYLSALGNRVDLLMRVGDYGAAWPVLERVLAHDRAPGREHQFLFAVPELQELALLEGDAARAHEAFCEGQTRLPASAGHPAWKKALVLEAARLLVSTRPGEALLRLEEAGRLPENRLETEPLRTRLVLSAGVDLGRAPDLSLLAAVPAEERILLEAELRLSRGEEPGPAALRELERRLATGPGAGDVTGRILEWAARFPRAFAEGAGVPLAAVGEKAAARAGLPRAAARLEPVFRTVWRPVEMVAAPRRAEPPVGFVSEDPSTRAVFSIVERIAPTSLALLVLGESGTGKEIVARAVHRLSGRAGRFVPFNVASLSVTLVESELFGHARGAFTGADRDRIGHVEDSSGGTLFLDEIGDLPLGIQPKLLRVLQEKEIRRVGETRTRRVDLRVVAATHRDLKAMTAAGTFREDLYYRLAQQEVTLAPLRERPRDLEALLARALDGAILSKDAARLMLAHPWPGNVRELLSAVESARALASPSRVLEVAHLPAAIRSAAADASPKSARYFDAVRKAKCTAILGALERSEGNRTRAAKDLGLSRQSLLYEIKKLRIEL